MRTLRGYLPVALCIVFVSGVTVLGQGSLDPPAGPPTPTMRSLDQIEPRIPITNVPFTISQSGSYYLPTNLVTTSSSDGIVVSANNVTIDLMGFTLDGDNTGDDGIYQGSSYSNLRVINGSIVNWESQGIEANGRMNHYENVTANQNLSGIWAGRDSMVRSCIAISNTSVSGTSYGFQLGDGTTIEDCIASWNAGGTYAYGVSAGKRCMVMRCNATGNHAPSTSYGFLVGSNSIVIECVADNNGEPNAYAQGIEADGGTQIIRCKAMKNGTNNINEAIYIDGHGGSVIDCMAIGNGGRGIMVVSDCLVRGNVCNENNVGIYAYSSRNRIEGNVCNRNESTGISVLNSATNNMVVCNMAVENGTDYSVSTSLNIMGPAATSLTNHPWANYSR